MNRSVPWERLVEAEDAYFERRQEMFEAGMDRELGLALQSAKGRGMALRVLRELPPDAILPHVGVVADIATRTHGQVGLAREVLSKVDRDAAIRLVVPQIEAMLAADADWETYRRSAEVLVMLGARGALSHLVSLALKSDDADIREVGEDFGS
ncbi:hypothetical protein SAMN04515671_2836 [Nakamurella panacisegetis]|uniref:HEAT repeat-containing protein n=1 Tax=Nakamurella panacisegetis TaxID=1090615 RepID=A0A1H0PN81_9ACTN|nr:hypothetical protein [Nakamurella panacisegetis]SDP06069.1 hypothetical protein SAMN04515671_2836 [Nakamurella panacisegetis]